MIATHTQRALLPTLLGIVVLLFVPAVVHGAQAPVKEIVSSHFGREVNLTEAGKGPALEDVCTVASKDECQAGRASSELGGLTEAESLAVAPDGNVYVAESVNGRVQEFTSSGAFVLMFGREVNASTKGDICTEEEIVKSGVQCTAGVEGTGAGEFKGRVSVSVDPSTGNVYVADQENNRVQEFTKDGEFVLMFGKEVNATTKGNVCTAVSKNTCKAGVASAEPGVFHFAEGEGFGTAAGGPEGLLFVGEGGRVQRFEADGVQVGETPTRCPVGALAVDPTGDMYVVCSAAGTNGNVIHEFSPSGEEIKHFALSARRTEAQELKIDAIALDAVGQLAVTEFELGISGLKTWRGGLYNIVSATSLHLVTEFTSEFFTDEPPPFATVGSNDIAVNAKDELYALVGYGSFDNEVVAYRPVPVAELASSPPVCEPGPAVETDVTSNCRLVGMVDPWGVKETEVSFEWGRSSGLGEKTSPTAKITNTKSEGEEEAPPVEVTAPIEGLRPNETFYFRATAQDENVKTPESLTSETVSFTTPSIPPRVVGEHDASFVSSSSAVLFGELNPENTPTEYFFEYGPCPELTGCETILRTGALESPVYGKIGVTLEATGLQPSTTYSYRLSGVNKPLAGAGEAMVNETGGTQLPEGSFKTAPAPLPQAVTGAASAIGSTSALIAGMVNPDGQPATYVFELGVYAGGDTRYGIVFSGPAGEGTTSLQQTLQVSGLQPGTTYAYRVVVKSGYGTAVGEPVLFTTAGLPAVLVVPAVLAQLPVPSIAFPNPPVLTPPKTVAKAKALTGAQKLVRALKACKQRPRSKRAGCEKQAREQYAKSKQATKRKKG
jgi:NHL repeat